MTTILEGYGNGNDGTWKQKNTSLIAGNAFLSFFQTPLIPPLRNQTIPIIPCCHQRLTISRSPEGRDNARTNGDVGHEAAIHHINVHPIGTGLQDISHLLAQLGKVCGKNRWAHLARRARWAGMGICLILIGPMIGEWRCFEMCSPE